MITVTPQAAKQIRIAAEQGNMEHLALRLAARKQGDGSIDYGMGFDEVTENDLVFNCEGIEIVFTPDYGPLLNGAVLDFVELTPGHHEFIFMNPNDANYTPPGGGCSSGCGGGGCSSH